MENLKLYDAEYKLMDIIWKLEPINSTELVKVCLEKLDWKKSTTYTVIRKLSKRNVLKNKDAMVIALVKRQDVQKYKSEELIEKSFRGSLPSFIATFLQDKKLSKKEVEEIKKIIEEAIK
ncbi:MAG: BlaI/MecI/CopY family transcriptional regulator [Eubacteriaceae bacterium]